MPMDHALAPVILAAAASGFSKTLVISCSRVVALVPHPGRRFGIGLAGP